MSLPKADKQEEDGLRAAQEATHKPDTGMVPAAPRIPKKFSKLVLLTAAKDSTKVAGAKRKGVHCIMSLGLPGPATLAKALLKTHPEAQRAIEEPPLGPEPKRCRLDSGDDEDVYSEGRLPGGPPRNPLMEGEEPEASPEEPGVVRAVGSPEPSTASSS
ncbi:FLYWCH family member 2 isoform X1 [Echinops telfairi]|uniref:FLYWCH family member 2 isoform X1 n=2 Tax=Echinops telfairi TaxID=9371 RepID=A0AC55CQ19_ECHTE|nr:FLYWCH family member 2 isoform X1 [Echinops telfairi]XP_045141250.1 FLYWCH family member 2 isoform X1 [Echinops telfairi]